MSIIQATVGSLVLAQASVTVEGWSVPPTNSFVGYQQSSSHGSIANIVGATIIEIVDRVVSGISFSSQFVLANSDRPAATLYVSVNGGTRYAFNDNGFGTYIYSGANILGFVAPNTYSIVIYYSA